MLNINLRSVTTAEALWIWRRRAELTQRQAANQLGIPFKTYWNIEAGRMEYTLPPDIYQQRNFLSEDERCAIARRRCQFFFTIRELAKRFGISHVTLIAWERDGDPRLMKAWKAEGFRF